MTLEYGWGRDVFGLRHRDPEPALGPRPALRGRGGRPVRRPPGALRRRAPLRARPRRDGLCDDARHAASRRRRAHRLRPLGLLVQPGARRLRQAAAGEVAAHGLRRRHGGGLLRPVPVSADRQRPDRSFGWQQALVVFAASAAPGPAAVARARDAAAAQGVRRRAGAGGEPVDRQALSGGFPAPLLRAAGARLLHLRLPARLHHRAPAGLPQGRRPLGRSAAGRSR